MFVTRTTHSFTRKFSLGMSFCNLWFFIRNWGCVGYLFYLPVWDLSFVTNTIPGLYLKKGLTVSVLTPVKTVREVSLFQEGTKCLVLSLQYWRNTVDFRIFLKISTFSLDSSPSSVEIKHLLLWEIFEVRFPHFLKVVVSLVLRLRREHRTIESIILH